MGKGDARGHETRPFDRKKSESWELDLRDDTDKALRGPVYLTHRRRSEVVRLRLNLAGELEVAATRRASVPAYNILFKVDLSTGDATFAGNVIAVGGFVEPGR